MKTIYNYIVGDMVFTDTEPFGKAWKDAKSVAGEKHVPIYRTELKIRRQVYATGGIFIDDCDEKINPQIF
jgi:hypothetical protein